MSKDTGPGEKTGFDPEEQITAKAGVEPSPFRQWRVIAALVAVIIVAGVPGYLLLSGTWPGNESSQSGQAGEPGSEIACGDGVVEGLEDCESASDCTMGQDCVDCQCVCPQDSPCYGQSQGAPCLDPGGAEGTCAFTSDGRCLCALACTPAADCYTSYMCDPGEICWRWGPEDYPGLCMCVPECPDDSGGCHLDGDCPDGTVCNPTSCECVPPGCGNGVVEADEDCDGDNLGKCDPGDKCANCQCASLAKEEDMPLTPLCGNGAVNSGEDCDPPGSTDGCGPYEICNATCGCVLSPYCGNNWVDPGEDCEFLYCDHTGCQTSYGCSASGWCDVKTCQCVEPTLVDGMTPIPTCGNGIVNTGEDCDSPGSTGGCGPYEICNATCGCVPSPYCGNNWVDPGEDCEFLYCEGNSCQTAYGCTSPEWCNVITCQCEAEPMCGDGVINLGEQCDTGNEPCDEGQSCADNCRCEVICGDGIMGGDEQCDGQDARSLCGPEHVCQDCRCVTLSAQPGPEITPLCGNGTLDAGEQCDGSGAHCVLTVPGAGDDWSCVDCTCLPPCDFDGKCEEGENVSNCSEDCGSCGDGAFSPAAGEECDTSAGVGCTEGKCEDCQCTIIPGGKGGEECDPDACRDKCSKQGCDGSQCVGNTCVCEYC